MIALSVAAATAGCGLALGAVLLARALRPRRVDPVAALHRLTQPPAQQKTAATGALSRLAGSGPVTALARGSMLTLPHQDLALLGATPEDYVAYRLLTALTGLLIGPIVAAVPLAEGVHLPLEVPAALSLLLAAGLWMTSAQDFTGKAATARRDAKYHLLALLDITALEISASSAPLQAIEQATAALDAWSTARIADTLLRAQLAARAPWDTLETLGRQIGLTALAETAGMLRAAQAEGTGAHTRLTARADALRAELAADEEAAANAASERMVIPMTVLVLIFMILIGYPLVTRIR
jgi:hypothetical protein